MVATSTNDPYAILGVDRSATDAVIAAAHRRLARTFHPDVDGPVKIWRSAVLDRAAVASGAGSVTVENGRIAVYCEKGCLEVLELQVPGGRRLPARDFLLGNSLEGPFR